MSKVSDQRIIEVVESILGTSDRVQVDLNDAALAEVADQIHKSRVRLELSKQDITVEIPKNGSVITFGRIGALGSAAPAAAAAAPESKVKPQSRPKPRRHQHTYVPPKMAKAVMNALLDEGSHVIWFKGPTGTGKTMLAHYLANELGYELFQLNCHPGMGAESFFGEKTIEVDEATGQNHIVFQEGVVVKAMQAGLDESGNEVGKPGLLFIDEAGAMPTGSIALNRLLESDEPRRTISLEHDGGRVVRSHSKFRIILAANTAGRGATDMAESAYTAQMDAQDISLLDRVDFTYRFGYDRKVEKHIAMEKLGEDKVVSQLLKFRDAIRDNIRAGKLSTPFSTRSIVKISNGYRIYGDLGEAVYYTVFEHLLPEEKPVYNEIAVAQMGVDILKEFVEVDVDYM
jgi:MoxR-like ATPase